MPEIASWDAYNEAVWPEQVGDPLSPVTMSLRHPSYPFEAEWAGNDPQELRGIVATYLSKVRERLGLPELFSSGSDFEVLMAWLKLPEADNNSLDPRESFWVTRYKDPVDQAGTIDRSVVFVAGKSWRVNDSAAVLGSRLGLRVVAHLHKRGSAPWKVRVTSVACSAGLPQALVPHGMLIDVVNDFYTFIFSPSNFLPIQSFIRRFARVDPDTPVAIDGVRATTVNGRASGVIYATALRPPDDPQAVSYALTLQFGIASGGTAGAPTVSIANGGAIGPPIVEKLALVAHAVTPVRANLFARDPASKAGLGRLIKSRPNRSPERLNAFKANNVLLEGISLDGFGDCILTDDRMLVDVRQSTLVDDNADEGASQEVCPANVVQPRRNDFAALGGYERALASFNQHHLRPLFSTLIAYGLWPLDYFRFAINPLQIRYRSPITPGPGKDGKTVNAQVDFDPPDCNLIADPRPWTPDLLKPLLVRFALADLKRSSSRRQPLGLAADPRWSWHEYCHVLLAAQTGRLELHFAHSAGDALAAILSDPYSKLAKKPWPRGFTFPWVYLHRRHDRAVDRGWGWSGRRHRPNRFPAVGCNCQHKGYDSEQILSTTLFRLYLALGGDTVHASGKRDRPARQHAADYTVYLILRAIKLMPAYNVSVVETADQFVTTLIDADIATWPASSGPLKDRAGGWAHKVVRWAFEAQGLYATTDPLKVINRPGSPPPVDIFIDTRRPRFGGYLHARRLYAGLARLGGRRPQALACGGRCAADRRRQDTGRCAQSGIDCRHRGDGFGLVHRAAGRRRRSSQLEPDNMDQDPRPRPACGAALAGTGGVVRAFRPAAGPAGDKARVDPGDRRLRRRPREFEPNHRPAVLGHSGVDRRSRGRRQQSRALGGFLAHDPLAPLPLAPGQMQDAAEGRADRSGACSSRCRGLPRRLAEWRLARPYWDGAAIWDPPGSEPAPSSAATRSRRRASDWPASLTGNAHRRAPCSWQAGRPATAAAR